jgi:hypothetical protein
MRRDVHLDIGTRVIDTTDGMLGKVTTPHYMAKPDPHEICINWDGSGPETSGCIDRHNIEYEGNGIFEQELVKWGHVTLADYAPGSEVYDRSANRRGTIVADDRGLCGPEQVAIRHGDEKEYVAVDWNKLFKYNAGK